jgi:hypothetical protein
VMTHTHRPSPLHTNTHRHTHINTKGNKRNTQTNARAHTISLMLEHTKTQTLAHPNTLTHAHEHTNAYIRSLIAYEAVLYYNYMLIIYKQVNGLSNFDKNDSTSMQFHVQNWVLQTYLCLQTFQSNHAIHYWVLGILLSIGI